MGLSVYSDGHSWEQLNTLTKVGASSFVYLFILTNEEEKTRK